MAAQTPATKAAVDFNKMIQADREKRKNETLAKEIFGRNRRQGAPNASAGIRKPAGGGSLASRIGPAKPAQRQQVVGRGGGTVAARYARNAPAASNNIDKAWTHDMHSPSSKTVPTGPKLKNQHTARLANAFNKASSPNFKSQVNVVNTIQKGEFSIKGIAGPCIVQAQNFAPGTSIADIESAMLSVGSKVLKTTLLATSPMVIAEIAFETREAANCVIDTFNGQTADGRVLKLFIKPGEVTPADLAPSISPETASSISPAIPSGPRIDRRERSNQRSDQTQSTEQSHRPDLLRHGISDTYRPNYESRDRERDARAEVIDGSYGFGDQDRMDTDEVPRQMYSDAMIPQNNGSRNGAPQARAPSGPRNGGRGGRGRGGYGGYR